MHATKGIDFVEEGQGGDTSATAGGRFSGRLRALSLRQNVVWTFAGNAVYAACQWAMLSVLAKLGSAVAVGQFTLGLAVAAPVYMLANLQLRAVQATDAQADFDFQDYLGLRLLTTALAVVVVLGVAALSGYGAEAAAVVALLGVAKGVESVSDVIYGQLQQRERMDWVSWSLLIRGPLSLAVLAVLLLVTGSLVWATAGLAVSWVVVMVGHDLPRCRQAGGRLRPRFHGSTLRHLVVLTLPLGGVMMFLSLNTSVPRYLVEHELGTYELGVFSSIAYLLVVGTTVVSAVGQSASPRLSRFYAEGDVAAFRRLLFRLIGLGLGLGAGGVVVAATMGAEILELIYTPEYATYSGVLVAVMTVAVAHYALAFVGYGMTAAREFRVQLPIFAVAAAVTLGVGWWAIPRLGLYGAVLALFASVVARGVGGALVLFRILRGRRSLPTSELAT